MIFAAPFGAQVAQAINQALPGFAPASMRLGFSLETESRVDSGSGNLVRDAAALVCRLRAENRTEPEIVTYLRRKYANIMDIEIIQAVSDADATCPVAAPPQFTARFTTMSTETAPPPELPAPYQELAPSMPAGYISDRDVDDTICILRANGIPEENIEALLRLQIPGVTDEQIMRGYASADTFCPPQIEEAAYDPEPPYAPEPPPVVTVLAPVPPPPPSSNKWLILGGIAAGVLGVGGMALYFSRKK